jgi:hypothetical protein
LELKAEIENEKRREEGDVAELKKKYDQLRTKYDSLK